MAIVRAWAASSKGQPLKPFTYDPGPLPDEEVDIEVEHCGICHSDLSVLDDAWGMSVYPFVPGHEIVGRIAAAGPAVRGLAVGQRVGVGWTAASCLHCGPCMSGRQHLCAQSQPTMIGRHGGFAERVRAHWAWAIPIPDDLDSRDAGPLMCGGITVFAPLVAYDVRPTDRVGVVGIGGLGHLAVKFAAAWGCEVTAFTSSDAKRGEAQAFGAHRVVSSRDGSAIRALAGQLDLLLVTVNVPLDWSALLATLAPGGRLHFVGAVLEPVPIAPFELIGAQKSVSGSPIGPPHVMRQMLQFAARHRLAPQTEHFPMSRVNEALARLRAGQARYRIVLDADF